MRKIEDAKKSALASGRFLLFDGGLGSELERRGVDVKNKLWSARALLDAQEIVRSVHRDYLVAGAQVIATNTYQASLSGFNEAGLSDTQAIECMRAAVELAVEERLKRTGSEALVLLSCGPYGATLADGSEYRGDDKLPEEELYRFHRNRLEIFREAIGSGRVDGVEFSTIPSIREVRAIMRLMDEWRTDYTLCVSHSTPLLIADGTPLSEVFELYKQCSYRPSFIGSNCMPPDWTETVALEWMRLVKEFSGSENPREPAILLYPNFGGSYDAETKTWSELQRSASSVFFEGLRKAVEYGVSGIGGCCRSRPEDIEKLAQWNAN